jgi:hypothetical protein
MLIHEFDELWEARRFQPFRIYTADGRSVSVKSPAFAWHGPASRIVWVASGTGRDRTHMIDLQHVTKFVVSASESGRNDGGRRRKK